MTNGGSTGGAAGQPGAARRTLTDTDIEVVTIGPDNDSVLVAAERVMVVPAQSDLADFVDCGPVPDGPWDYRDMGDADFRDADSMHYP